MPTLLNENGFKFFFYANEHEPKHIHVIKGDGFAKIELCTLNVVQNYLKPKELITTPINNLKYAIMQHGKDRCKKTNTKRVG